MRARISCTPTALRWLSCTAALLSLDLALAADPSAVGALPADTPVTSEPPVVEDHWITSVEGCSVRNPMPVPNESASWSGSCIDGMADGPGVLQWRVGGKPGSRVEASFVRGSAEGIGRMTTSGGTTYVGALVHGEKQGHGTMKWPNGDAYEGDWLGGRRTGKGVLTRASGDRYDGDFVDGKWEGEGVFSSHAGWRYEGHWHANRRQGQGVETHADGTVIRAEWDNDRLASAARPASAGARYRLTEDTTGSLLKETRISNISVPPEKSWSELSDLDKERVKASYEPMAKDDEPPYPLHGPRRLLLASLQVRHHLRLEGLLDLVATIDPEGKVLEIKVYRSPDDEVTPVIAALLASETFKPAVCSGKPCQMEYRLAIDFLGPTGKSHAQ